MPEISEIKEFMQAIGPLLTVVSTLTAVWLTQRGNRKTLKQQIIRDEKKEKRDELRETLGVYDKILKIHGENAVVIDVANKLEEFDYKVYQKEVRPILYEKYHLLHDEVAMIVNLIDEDIKRCTFFGEFEDRDHVGLCNYYNDLIRKIRWNIHIFRKEDSKEDMSFVRKFVKKIYLNERR
ncbi:hypothetical protein LKM00_27630 [Bacillus wiedmannii]|uniref:hypothetical protein n=1 Tax=Bacillus wiedmannii TaxID=1890302 RepID=UPI001E605CB1|nr:hypothetical protein [Bacillus wiedmannii]MCC2381167.1 hypothetical protein [Bacillus wiedmannii]MCC2425512.1 hypothetical protein [Bacillus wiedmannii]